MGLGPTDMGRNGQNEYLTLTSPPRRFRGVCRACTESPHGGVESTFERRRRWAGEPATIPEGLVRLAVGIENVEDLWRDLHGALTFPR